VHPASVLDPSVKQVIGYGVRVCVLDEIVPVILKVFSWGHYSEVTVEARLSTGVVRSLSKLQLVLGMFRSAMKSLLIVVCAWMVPLVLG
jgi:hypothetical protein